jgi:hypothetical protein
LQKIILHPAIEGRGLLLRRGLLTILAYNATGTSKKYEIQPTLFVLILCFTFIFKRFWSDPIVAAIFAALNRCCYTDLSEI